MVLMPDLQHDGEELKPVREASRKEKAALIHSEAENGGEEKRKSGKPSPGVSRRPPSDAECYEDQKKALTSRSKAIVNNTFLVADSKPERKKHGSSKLKSNAQFHKLFLDVPADEPLRQNFTCALQKEILYQGKLFISENWICFHSKVFGKDTKIIIPVLSVTQLKKSKTALLVPNALVITTTSDRYIFGSFLSRDTAYKLLKAVCQHVEDVSVGNSPNPPSPENSFRNDRPSTLPLDFTEDFSELDGIIHQRRREMEESSSTGSQTPEFEHYKDFRVVETQTHLKTSKTETKSVHSDAQSKCLCDDKVRNVSRNVLPGALGFFCRVNYHRSLSVNHILILYAIMVCVLVFSTFYMRYRIHGLEEQLGSMASFVDSHTHEQPIQESLESPLNLNVDGLCEELTANLIRLEKVCYASKKSGALTHCSQKPIVPTFFQSVWGFKALTLLKHNGKRQYHRNYKIYLHYGKHLRKLIVFLMKLRFQYWARLPYLKI
ncbi:GRAM domain-containing protein 2B isoform X2 [Varanus komodoensis]|uniref:GRAM domain-containing protein 2B isoform X2 n=1 Tax=Varanus komodoensis TaxID=61221 RepID=UPI001CF7E32A|nr:GRAM domain-containing protein 2B isoform X2 [Varanus komodoensis]